MPTTALINKFGRLCFAISMIAFGAFHFIAGDFTTGRAPVWPDTIPGKLVWAYVSGIVFILTGLGIMLSKKNAWTLIMLSALMIFVWAFLRYVPILGANLQWGSELTCAGKALALFGGTFAVAASLQDGQEYTKKSIRNQPDSFMLMGSVCLGIFMIIGGIEHFIFVDFVLMLMPTWIPGSLFWVYFAGVALIAGGLGMMIGKTAYLAAALSGTMIFMWFVTLHIPRAVSAGNDMNEWIAVSESLAFSGIAFVLVKKRK
jgi:uncharacterized membrane protein